MTPPIVTLTSDFGPGPFVAVMKGVILGLCPQAVLVDVTHLVPAQDVDAGALAIRQVLGAFASGTVHLAVVDPGVGTRRRALVVAGLDQLFVGPDNGLFTPVFQADPAARAWAIQNPDLLRQPVSHTFHGRDVFAPVAAHLARGLEPARVGPPVSAPVVLDWPTPRAEGEALVGAVLGVDGFGNLTTNLERGQVEAFLAGAPALVRLDGRDALGPLETYAQAAPGNLAALYDSLDRLELTLNRGDLAAELARQGRNARGLRVSVWRRR